MSQIARLRLARGLSQVELAKLLGVSEFTVQKWETGKRNPRAKRLKRLARILRCPLAALQSSRSPSTTAGSDPGT